MRIANLRETADHALLVDRDDRGVIGGQQAGKRSGEFRRALVIRVQQLLPASGSGGRRRREQADRVAFGIR